jgi:cell division protein FtsA
MKLGLNKKSKKRKTYLAIDIGTENIKSVLFTLEDDGVNVIGYNRMPQKPFAMNKALILDLDEVLNSLDKSLGVTVTQAENIYTDISLPDDVIVGIAGELVSGVPVVVNVDRDVESEKITKQEIDNIVNKVKEHTFESTKEEIAEEIGFSTNQIVEIETVINSIAIDGIKTKDPVGNTGESMSYRVFSTFAPKFQVETIEKLAKHLKLNLAKIVVEPYALGTSLETLSFESSGAIILDIGAGTTDIVVIKDGEVLGTKMFAIGGRVFTKRIQKEFAVDYKEAEDLKQKYSVGNLDEYRKNEIKKILKNDIDAWLVGVELALEEFEDVEEYPHNIYLCGGGAMLPEIKEGLMAYPWIQSLRFSKHPKINFLLPNKIDRVTDLTKTATNSFDVTPLALARSILD